MRVFRKLEDVPAGLKATVVSVGNFDGVHRAHQMVLREVIARARALGVEAWAVTLEPHPLRVLRPEAELRLITPLEMKLRLLDESGLDAVLVIPFTRDFSQLSPREFCAEVLVRRLRAREVHEGESFRFGHKAAGDLEQLKRFGAELGFAVKGYGELRFGGDVASSSRIRELIAEGRVARARHLLGRPFAIAATPDRGRGVGRRYTVPTINIERYPELAPRNGVYVTRTALGSAHFDSVTNLGVRPTFETGSFAIETHLLDFEPMEVAADAQVEIIFLHRLRDEKKFPTVDALRTQIARDVERTRRYFRRFKVQPA